MGGKEADCSRFVDFLTYAVDIERYASKSSRVFRNSLKQLERSFFVGEVVTEYVRLPKFANCRYVLPGLTASVIRANRLLPERKLHFTAHSTNSLCNSLGELRAWFLLPPFPFSHIFTLFNCHPHKMEHGAKRGETEATNKSVLERE